tara:strand:- start:372 stop:1520 length:1149 start_codon:yes stop_codon:yes gene_type:complete
VYVLATLSGRGVAYSSQRFGYKVGIMDVFGDKDCLSAAVFWRHIGTCCTDQSYVDSKKFLNSLPVFKINGFKGLVIGSGFEGKYGVLRKANEILPLYANPLSVFKCIENPILFFKTLKLLGVPFPKVNLSADSLKDVRSDWILKDLGSSGGLGIKKPFERKSKNSQYFQKLFPGTAVSLSFFADGQNVIPLGYSKPVTTSQGNLPFVFCGLDGPIELNSSVDQEALRLSKLIVQKFKLRGFNGIDFLVSDKVVYFLDLNPRITAAFEILQESYNFCFFEKHIHLTRDIPCNTYITESFPAMKKKIISGFRIIYAQSDFYMNEHCQQSFFNNKFLTNIPNRKYFFKKYEPVCSVFLRSNSILELQRALDDKVDFVYDKLSQLN